LTDIAETIRRFGKVKRIVSYHNLREMPANLEQIHERMCQQDADVVKIAVMAQQPRDNLRVLDLVKDAPKPTVAFCLGDLGVPSRILGAKYGAPFTYAAFNKERGLAPGLPSLDDLRHVLPYERVQADTEVFGVIGDPVGHSLSPLLHNTAFRQLGINAIYLPFRVPEDDLAPFLTEFERLPVKGYSVTIPHKEAAAQFATHKDTTVEATHAANTLIRDNAGFTAYNTDSPAALQSLLANLPTGPDGEPGQLGGRTVLLLGAGGVARAVLHGLKEHGTLPTIVNRNADRSHRLAEEFGCRALDWAARHSVLADLVINCTSVGMYPNVDESPLHNSYLKPGLTVMELVYTPEQTLLVKEARARGCHVITGVDMFVRQAALQFKLFTGKEAPLELMRSVVKKALSPVAIRDE
jgi:3-dehydroquinate dehydratase/shikimate dehydrogenase